MEIVPLVKDDNQLCCRTNRMQMDKVKSPNSRGGA